MSYHTLLKDAFIYSYHHSRHSKHSFRQNREAIEEQIFTKCIVFTSLRCHDYIAEMVSQALAVGRDE